MYTKTHGRRKMTLRGTRWSFILLNKPSAVLRKDCGSRALLGGAIKDAWPKAAGRRSANSGASLSVHAALFQGTGVVINTSHKPISIVSIAIVAVRVLKSL